jgi:hypothetical protein
MLTEAVERVEGRYTMERTMAIKDELLPNYEMEVLQMLAKILATTRICIGFETISRS